MPYGLGLVGVLAIVVGFALGYVLYQRQGHERGRTASAAVSSLTGLFWVSVGIFLIAGGFYVIGIVVIGVFFYIAASNAREVDESTNIRTRIAGRR